MLRWQINGKAQTIKQWALDWGISVNAARGRLYTLSGRKKAIPVRL